MTSKLNKRAISAIKSYFDPTTNTYDDYNNWNIVSACSVCSNNQECKYNTPEVFTKGTCLHFNNSDFTKMINLYYDVGILYSSTKIIEFRDGVVNGR